MYEELLTAGKGYSNFGSIKCPRHYMLKPGMSPFKKVFNKHIAHLSDEKIDWLNKKAKDLGIDGKLRRWTYAKDRNGNKIQDFNNFYQPNITKGFAIEHVYDPEHPICKMQCRGRCLEGIGKPNIKAIKRLSA